MDPCVYYNILCHNGYNQVEMKDVQNGNQYHLQRNLWHYTNNKINIGKSFKLNSFQL